MIYAESCAGLCTCSAYILTSVCTHTLYMHSQVCKNACLCNYKCTCMPLCSVRVYLHINWCAHMTSVHVCPNALRVFTNKLVCTHAF